MAVPAAFVEGRDMPQNRGKQQRMIVNCGYASGRLRQGGSAFSDAILEANELVLLGIGLYCRHKPFGVTVQPVKVRRIDRVLHRLQPITFDNRLLDDPAPSML